MDERWGAQYWQSWRFPQTQLRIGHAERERTVEELKQHTHDGRLELHEFEERVGRAYAAKTQADLTALTTDLPPLHPVYDRSPHGRRSRGGRGFAYYASMAALWWYLSLSVLMIFVWAISGTGFFWPILIIGPWGVMMLPAILVGRRGRRARASRADARRAVRARRRERRASWY